MKLLVLSESPNHVSCRYRVRAFEPALRDAGWEVVEHPLSPSLRGFHTILREASRSDVVLVQRRLLSRPKVALLRRCARRLIYDVDDAVFLRDSNSTRRPECLQRQFRFRAIVQTADAIIAGNSYLAECATRYSRQARIETIPTCVDPNAYPAPGFAGGGAGLRVAWIGSSSTLPSLNEIGPALREAGRRVHGLELHVICDRLPDLPGVDAVLHRWSHKSEASALSRCDIGVSWLPDHPWSRGKCGLKVLQYMAAGLPVVVNSLGVHQRMVSPGVEGLVIGRPAELGDALLQLAHETQRRVGMGRGARRRVETEFSLARWSDRFVEVVSGERIAA